MNDQRFYNLIAVVGITIVAASFGVGYLGASMTSGPPAPASASSAPTDLYLTININPYTGWPQYTPANFSVPEGTVMVTITDYDAPGNWSGCLCNVTGTVGGIETVNGTPTSDVSSANVAHSFDIPALGLNVVSPGLSTVTFTLQLNQTGTYTWYCMAPCGYPPEGPMGVPGYMTGTMTVVG